MKKFRVVIQSVSTVISAIVLVVANGASAPVFAADTGGYPWADAVLLNSRTYDWGYPHCQPAMQAAKTCSAHVSRHKGVMYYQSDPWRYDVRNCTSYVAWRIHNDFGVAISGWGDAGNWDNAAVRAEYSVDMAPRVGDVAVWEGYYGHVAFVTEVNDDGSVNVEQYNRGGTGQFSRESRVRAHKYIHIKPQSAVASAVAASPKASVPAEPAKAEVSPAVAVVRNTQLVPVPQESAVVPLPATSSAEYDIVRDAASGGVVVYETRFNNTATGKVELSVSDLKDGNTTWKQTWAIDQLAHEQNQTSYKLADYNADGSTDLYQIKYAHSSSNQTEVRVFDGSQQYARLLGSWNTGLPTHTSGAANYGVADHDGDGKLDIYKVQSATEADKQVVTVLDGAKLFAEVLGSWQAEEPLAIDGYIAFGDDDGDGKVDIYQTTPHELGGKKSQVLSAENSYARVTRSLVTGRSVL